MLFGLEDFGFCGPGESGPFAASGALAGPAGSLPTNTAGGNLSEAYMQGLNHVIEGVRQLRGDVHQPGGGGRAVSRHQLAGHPDQRRPAGATMTERWFPDAMPTPSVNDDTRPFFEAARRTAW